MIATASNLQLMQLLRETPEASAVLEKIMAYLHTYGHQGYSLDFVEPTQIELVLATRCIRQLYTLLRRNCRMTKRCACPLLVVGAICRDPSALFTSLQAMVRDAVRSRQSHTIDKAIRLHLKTSIEE